MFERNEQQQHVQLTQARRVECLRNYFDAHIAFYDLATTVNGSHAACLENCDSTISGWSLGHSMAFAFSVVTVLGFGSMQVLTTNGKIFYLLYAFLGIPMTMVIFANAGRFFSEFVTKICTQTLNRAMDRRYRRSTQNSGVLRMLRQFFFMKPHAPDKEADPDSEQEVEYNSSIFVILFVTYLIVGALIIAYGLKQTTFIDGVYANFRALTADFGEFAPESIHWLIFSLLYIGMGLTLVTSAFDIMGTHLRKLNNIGKKLKNVAKVKIWFGGTQMSVHHLVNSFGKAAGVPDNVMEKIDLDKLEPFNRLLTAKRFHACCLGKSAKLCNLSLLLLLSHQQSPNGHHHRHQSDVCH